MLVALCATLVLSVIEPGISTALAESANTKRFDTNYKLDPLKSDKQQDVAPLAEPGKNTDLYVKSDRTHVREDVSKRTTFTSTYINKDGTKTMEYTPLQQNYNDGKTWQKINNKLSDNGKSAPSPNLWESMTNTAPKAVAPTEFTGKSGVIDAQMQSLSHGISFTANGKKITMIPVGAVASVASAGLEVAQTRYQGGSWKNAIGAGVISGATDAVAGKIKLGTTVARAAGKVVWGGARTAFSSSGLRHAIATAPGRLRLAKFTTRSVVNYYAGNTTQNAYGYAAKKYRQWRH